MWSPTHVQVTVMRAKGILWKNHNKVFVTIALGKEKFQTSNKERGEGSNDDVEWREKCELKIPSGNNANKENLVLTLLSHNFMGVDNFLGRVTIPINELDHYERPRSQWYPLQDKHQERKSGGDGAKSKERGELEVKVGFSVKPGSLGDVSKKDKRRGSLGQLSQKASSHIGGSLASLSSVDKRSFRNLAKNITKKIKKKDGNKKFEEEDEALSGVTAYSYTNRPPIITRQHTGDADPGVISEDDDEFVLDDLSNTGSGCSLEVSSIVSNSTATTTTPPSSGHKNLSHQYSVSGGANAGVTSGARGGANHNASMSSSFETIAISTGGETADKDFGGSKTNSPATHAKFHTLPPFRGAGGAGAGETGSASTTRSTTPIVPEKYVHRWEQRTKSSKALNKSSERIVVGGESKSASPLGSGVVGLSGSHTPRLSAELIQRYEMKTREDLIELVESLQSNLTRVNRDRKELEDYIDNLLLKVIEHSPAILQNPYS